MLRSFHYATFTALLDQSARGLVEPDSDAARDLETWGRAWCDAVSRGVPRRLPRGAARTRPGSPPTPRDLAMLLDTSLLEKAIYELTYELNNRPLWVPIALMGIADLVGPASTTADLTRPSARGLYARGRAGV